MGCGVDRDARVHCWGSDWGEGTLGNCSEGVPNPTERGDDIGGTVDFGTWDDHACRIDNDSVMTCTGSGELDQIGDGLSKQHFEWIEPLLDQQVVDLAVGTYGQVGDGTTSDRPQPVQVGSGVRWEEVDQRDYTTGGIQAGALYGWGSGSSGELGIGGPTFRTSPAQVGTDTDWERAAGTRRGIERAKASR